ncbi:MAG: LPS-assembly protein LptD, partial [Treponema sp.]|nr:LPS-assembly protein LptD [Treponema sp.]
PEAPAEADGGAAEAAAGEAAVGEGAAAEPGEENGEGAEEAPAPVDPAAKIREMDIKTSTLTELAAWCRSLGLSEGGTREELARRIREYFEMPPPAETVEETGRKIITIESARSTEYFTLDVVDEEYARLRGDVLVSLKDGDTVHRIKAWEILDNRTRNLITASGGVEYVKESGDTIETFRGDSITVNLDNWSSIFLDGISERSLQSSATTYRFAGTVISRSEEEVTVLTRASISSANNDEAFWSLNASKLWLLPGSDFAIFNAVLKVGEIPVLYFPFFYYPADEVIFHPVLGYRSREGNFLQTTTYILGRPKASSTSESSITKILGNSSDMEKRREGLFLRSTGKKMTNPGETTLKLMFDIYANLGAYLGTDLVLPRKGIFGSTDLSAGLGFTRDIKPLGNSSYTPFPSFDGVSEWNSAKLFSWDVPFRYRFKTSGSLGGSYGSLSWTFPYYSDPFVDRDFLNRTEEMDWVHMIQEGAALEEETSTENLLGAYDWRLNGSFRPSLPFLAPYISDMSISSISSTISFRTRNLTTGNPNYKDYAANRSFFYPDKFTIYSLSGSISGTPLALGGGQTNVPAAEETKTEAEDPFKNIGVPRSPWEKSGEERKPGEAENLVPPALSQRFDVPRVGGPRFSIDYRITPTTASELQFRSNEKHWPEYDKIDWSEVSSVLSTLGGDASTSFNLNHADGGAYSNVFTLSGSGSWQNYIFINEEAEEYTDAAGAPDQVKISEARRRTYNQTYFTTSYAYTSTVRPLYRSTVWGNSSLQYEFNGLLAKSAFIGTGEEPEWEVKYGAWDKDNLNSHRFSATVAASVMDKAQNFVFTAELPPKDSVISGNATFRIWITETNANTRILFPGEPEKQKFEPFYTTETLSFGKIGSLRQYMVFDTEIKEYTTLTTSLSLGGFGADYTMTRTKPYVLNYNGSVDSSKPDGWIQQDEEGLHPRDLTLRYGKTFRKDSLWKKRLSFSLNLNTSLYFDLQRYTNSRLTFSLGFTLGIANFVDLSLSTTSDNSVIYRYFKELPFFDFPPDLPSGEQDNFFIDLANSFRFDDDLKRRSSGFKLKSFNLSLNHHLGDWNAILGVTLSPYLDRPAGEVPVYKFNNEISFVVQWVPISEIKTDIQYNKEEWVFK